MLVIEGLVNYSHGRVDLGHRRVNTVSQSQGL